VLLEDGVNGLMINGNTFTGLSTAAVWSTGEVKNAVVNSNLCMDCGRKLAKKSAWLAVNRKNSVILRDNLDETPVTDP
jgi:hypothetical protein